MTADQWQQVKSLFEQCLDKPRSARAVWLMENCPDPELVAEALSLLDAHEDGSDFLEQPARAGVELMASIRPDSLINTRVGPYRLVEEIGRGGMGTVYRAVRDDDEFEIEVAIKIVGRGMDTDMLLRRFKTERQILAHLEHLHIGRLLDGGTTPGGLPYFVMEYVQGIPLTEYCDRHRLGVSERIRLFRKVCEAVSYAHNNQVIHRDLKPANILVTADGTPKLLDFGIARIMGGGSRDATEPTVTMLRMATPAYASPEQIRGGVVGPSTDIYSLGVILYELLTGHRPYRLPAQGSSELAKLISEREPTRASVVVGISEKIERSNGNVTVVEPEAVCHDRHTTIDQLRRRLRGDLDNILAMALRKEPHRRYETVDQLSSDLHRHLVGLPIIARKDTFGYRTSKFVERHRMGVVAGVIVAVMLLATSIFAIHKAAVLSARMEEDHRLASSFLVEIHDTIAKLPGSTAAREAVLEKSLQYLNGLARDAGGEPGYRRSLALAYERFAELQIGLMGPGLGRSLDALDTTRKAITIREDVAARLPADDQIRYELANAYLLGGYVAGRAGSAEVRTHYDRRALAIAERLVQADPRNPHYRSALARAHTSLAYGLFYADQWGETIKHLLKSLAIYSEIAAENPEDTKAKRDVAQIHYRLGATYAQSGQPAHAREHLTQALDVQQQILDREPENTQFQSDIAATHHFHGVALGAMHAYPQALKQFEEAITIRKHALAQDARDFRSRSMMAGTFAERATVMLHAGMVDAALASAKQAVENQERVLAEDSGGVPTRVSMADFESRLGLVYMTIAQRTGKPQTWDEAANWFRRSVQRYGELTTEGQMRTAGMRRDAEQARTMLEECVARSSRKQPQADL
jgi:non-specific serine/threonine protein kinase/serine/threonine-protein kinase